VKPIQAEVKPIQAEVKLVRVEVKPVRAEVSKPLFPLALRYRRVGLSLSKAHTG